MSDNDTNKFEYQELMKSYHSYFELVERTISMYLIIIGGTLSLPFVVQNLDNNFKTYASAFAQIITLIAVTLFIVASSNFWVMNKHIRDIATKLKIRRPNTWLMPASMLLACVAGLFLATLIRLFYK